MNLPEGVIESQWTAALSILPNGWKPDTPCANDEGWQIKPHGIELPVGRHATLHATCYNCGYTGYAKRKKAVMAPHDIPIPAVSGELLMALLRKLAEEIPLSLVKLKDIAEPRFIVLAAASLGEK